MPWEGDSYREPKQEHETATESCDDEDQRRAAAREFYLAAPPYRIDFELDGSVSLGLKHYEWWDEMAPEDATTWRTVSRHKDLEEAERRLRHLCTGPYFYDAPGRVVPSRIPVKPRWAMPPSEED